MSYLGSWNIDDNLVFEVATHSPATGALTDADSVPTYRVYEDETGTAILTGSMAKLDDTNTTGFYSEQIALSAANGFEKNKCYTVYITAAVGSVTGAATRRFQIQAAVDVKSAGGTAWNSGAITRSSLAPGSGLRPVRSGTAQGGTATTITLDASASSVNDFYPPGTPVQITEGTGADQPIRFSSGYNGTTKVLTVTEAWVTTVDSTSGFALFPPVSSADEIGAATVAALGTGSTLTAIPWNASWDAEVQSEVQDALNATLPDSIPADGTAPSIAQGIYMITQFLLDRGVSGTTVTVRKPDGSTTLFTLTINNATTPTSITRAT